MNAPITEGQLVAQIRADINSAHGYVIGGCTLPDDSAQFFSAQIQHIEEKLAALDNLMMQRAMRGMLPPEVMTWSEAANKRSSHAEMVSKKDAAFIALALTATGLRSACDTLRHASTDPGVIEALLPLLAGTADNIDAIAKTLIS